MVLDLILTFFLCFVFGWLFCSAFGVCCLVCLYGDFVWLIGFICLIWFNSLLAGVSSDVLP